MSSKQQLTVAGLVLVLGSPAAGQPLDSDVLAVLQGPPPPVAPEVVSRDRQGQATVRATRLRAPLQIDGRLDEPVYETVQSITDFIQQLPDEGALGSERTEAWVLFDDDSIYISARCYDTAPPSEWVANEMRRDVIQLRQNDSFSLMLDTFYDRRNGLAFLVTPIGGFSDFAISNEGGRVNTDWNTIWDSRTARFDGGWTVEIQIPFKSLRYRPTSTQVWGIQLRRIIRRRTEASYLTPLPISAARGNSVIAGLWRVSQAGSLVGIEVPSGSRKIEIKPYGIGGVTTDIDADSPTRNALDGQFGLDVKYGVTQNLTADFTYSTDFAQVEVDEQRVNLTRFSLFFPEKREFFLEARGNFDFARGAGLGGAGAPTLFFSRRIGLQGGDVVPILAGGRLTGKIGAFDVGALNIQTGNELLSGAQTTNFTVLRVKRDILRRSTIGGIFTNRSVSLLGDGSNQVYGIDGRLAFFDDVTLLGYVARTRTADRPGRDASYLAQFDYAGDRYGVNLAHLVIEDNFNPEIGFMRRDNIRRTTASGRFSPRPSSIDWVRRFSLSAGLDYTQSADDRVLETRQQDVAFEVQLENSDRFTVSATDRYELLRQPFTIAPGVTVPVGGYGFRSVLVGYAFGQQRPVSGSIAVGTGELWNGDITVVELGRGRVEVTPQLSVEPSLSLNWVELPEGNFATNLSRVRVSYTVSPRMFFSGLLQHNSSGNTFSTNVRLRWEYSPGSELFVVYTEDRDTDPFLPDRRTDLRNRGFVVKMNRLFRF
ncbi:MAG: carbohydrate binding family 9 domain-containing protein [Vicinamibacterales bacterium]|nr:carbohydrate binding family 9 domain-containing protein [Vicinamibacterales bacterium]